LYESSIYRNIMKKFACLASCVVLLFAAGIDGCKNRNDAEKMEKLIAISESVEQHIEQQRNTAADQVNELAKNADMIAALTAMGATFKEENRKEVQKIVTDFEAEQKCTFLTILNVEGHVVFRTSRPELYGDSQINIRSISEALTQQKSSIHYESTPMVPLAIRAVAPVFDENGAVVGVITGGFRLDTDEWVDHVKALCNVECTVFADDIRVATTVRKPMTDDRAIGTKLNNPAVYEKVFNEKENFYGKTTVVGLPMSVFYKPFFNEGDDKAVGMLFIGLP